MPNLIQIKYENLGKQIQTLQEAINKSKSCDKSEFSFFRDSVIQRYEYTMESFWKFLKYILSEKLGIETF